MVVSILFPKRCQTDTTSHSSRSHATSLTQLLYSPSQWEAQSAHSQNSEDRKRQHPQRLDQGETVP